MPRIFEFQNPKTFVGALNRLMNSNKNSISHSKVVQKVGLLSAPTYEAQSNSMNLVELANRRLKLVEVRRVRFEFDEVRFDFEVQIGAEFL